MLCTGFISGGSRSSGIDGRFASAASHRVQRVQLQDAGRMWRSTIRHGPPSYCNSPSESIRHVQRQMAERREKLRSSAATEAQMCTRCWCVQMTILQHLTHLRTKRLTDEALCCTDSSTTECVHAQGSRTEATASMNAVLRCVAHAGHVAMRSGARALPTQALLARRAGLRCNVRMAAVPHRHMCSSVVRSADLEEKVCVIRLVHMGVH